MAKRSWHGDSTKQQMLQACESRPAAEVLAFMTAVVKIKAKEHPGEPADSPKLWVQRLPMEHLVNRTGYSLSTIKRAVQTLAAKKFITIHTSRSFDRSYSYQVHPEAIGRYLQRMPLFEHIEDDSPRCQDDTMQGVTMEPCKVPPRHHARCQDEPLYIHSSPSLDQSSPSSPGGDGTEKDEEKDKIITEYRKIGIAKETTEAYLTDNSRQKMFMALAYVRSRVDRITNPAGMVLAFLKSPQQFGYEMDQNGCWMPAKAIAARKMLGNAKTFEELPVITSMREEAKKIRDEWAAIDSQRRYQAWKMMADEGGIFQAKAFEWKAKDQELIDPPYMFLGQLKANLNKMLDAVTTNA